jgi:hypothetical protein
MKINGPLIMFLSIAVTGIILLSCQNKLNPIQDFLIKVDSIHAPDTVVAGSRFDIEFFGTIGFNGCVSFKTFNQIVKKNAIVIEAWGNDNQAETCPTVMVYLDNQKLNMTIPLPGRYRISISEPDNSSIVKLIISK